MNQRHADFQSAALPTELQRHTLCRAEALHRCVMATPNGLEPSTSSVTGWRANRLHHRAVVFGGNNRARTCDPMLVRHVLSQLSYAPVSRFGVFPSATRHIIAQGGRFVKHFFLFFSKNLLPGKTPGFSADQTVFRISRMSSGLKRWMVSQNWQVMFTSSPSSMISVSSFRPREISAASMRSREQ